MGPRAIRTAQRAPVSRRRDSTPTTRAQRAAVPRYQDVAHKLRADIVAGTYAVGARLPTEEALSARFRVSRHTIRAALRCLRDDNLVSSRQGAGTVVASSPATGAYAHDVMSINDLVSWSVGKRFVIDRMQMIDVEEDLASGMEIQHGTQWLAVYGVGHEEGVDVPVCGAEYYIHKDFAAVGRLLHRHAGPIFPLLEDLFGVKVVEVHQSIGAALISAALAQTLNVAAGSPALEVQRTYRLSSGQIAQATRSTHPAARYRHSMTLRRINI